MRRSIDSDKANGCHKDLALSNLTRPQTPAPTVRAGHRVRRLLSSLPGLAAAGFLCGCQVLSYSGPSGERVWRGSLGAKTSIASLSFEAGTNGLRRFEMKGYHNDSSQALAIVTDAAVRAALEAAK